MAQTRLDNLKAALAARTDPAGKPIKGYRKNVAALKAEILRLCDHPRLVAEHAARLAQKAAIDMPAPAAVPSTPDKPIYHRS